MSVISFKMGDITCREKYQTTHQYRYLLYWNGFLTSTDGKVKRYLKKYIFFYFNYSYITATENNLQYSYIYSYIT